MDNPYRLPRLVVPRHYDLTLEPDLDAAAFRGRARIDVEVVEATDTIVLNAIELEFDSVLVAGQPAEVDFDERHERATLTVPRGLQPGPAAIDITYAGVLNDLLRGFYRSTFTDTGGETRTIATTQFEPTNARRAFPCWDEPDLKATFAVTLVVPADLLAISSGEEQSSRLLDDGRREVSFAPTIPMSTYLLAFVVGPLEATDPVDVDGVALRVVHPIGMGNLTEFALEVGAFSLRHFTEYFAIPYPGPKLDLVAIPDFASGAMENFGCITFREYLLLLDPAKATQPELQNVSDVIAHEIAHMWFGDLVTMKWWNGIWLKEAFATFCEMHATDAFRPDWQRWAAFGLSRSAAFDVDALESTRPVEYHVESPDDADDMYDLLTYEKGAAVVRMLEQYLGADRFRDGIRDYLARHSLGNTETTDLWDAIEETTGEPTRTIMDSWIFQAGYPVLRVDRREDSSYRLTQSQFAYSGNGSDGEWLVPAVLGTADGLTEPVLVDGSGVVVDLGDPAWVLANRDASGFYRVRYDEAALAGLLEHLDELRPIERYGLIDDRWALVVAGEIEPDAYLDFIDWFRGDPDLAVWQRIVSTLRALEHLAADPARDGFKAWAVDLMAPTLHQLGWVARDGDDDRTRQLRATVFETTGVFGDATAGAKAVAIHADDAADPPMNAAAVRVIASTGDAATFDEFTQRFKAASTPQEELRYLYALADFPDKELIGTLIRMTSDGTVRTQDAPFVLARAMGNRHGGRDVWGYVASNWDDVNERFPHNSIVRLVDGIRALSWPDTANAIRAFFEEHKVPQGAMQLQQHLERLHINVELRERVDNALTSRFG